MGRRFTWLGALALVVAVTGCGSSNSSNSSPSPADCLERMPSMSSGIYGCVTSTDDVGTDLKPQVFPDFTVEVFAEQPPPTPEDGLLPLASAKSDALGFYQLRLDPGSYSLCTTFRRCTAIDVVADVPLRKNYDFSVGPGW